MDKPPNWPKAAKPDFSTGVLYIWAKWMNDYLTHEDAMNELSALVEISKFNKDDPIEDA